MNIETKNLFAGIPADLPQELFTDLVSNNNVKIHRIVSKGHTSPDVGWYDQEDHEWVIVLRGAAKIAFENGNVVDLKEGDYLNIPAHVKHKVSWTEPGNETIWLAVHYNC